MLLGDRSVFLILLFFKDFLGYGGDPLIGSLVLYTVIIPIGLGLVLAYASRFFSSNTVLSVIVVAVMTLVIYVLLEGVPKIPPVSSKHKIAVLLFVAPVLIVALSGLKIPLSLTVGVILVAGLAWLGQNRLADAAAWPRFLALLVPLAAVIWSGQSDKPDQRDALLWPVTLLVFALGASILSLLGAYIGLAQLLGALAAWLGGYVLYHYCALLFRGSADSPFFAGATLWAAVSAILSVHFASGLFAPSANSLALACLGLVFLAPKFYQFFQGLPQIIRPIAIGLAATAPVLASIVITTN